VGPDVRDSGQQALQDAGHDLETALLYATYARRPLNILLTVLTTVTFAPLLWPYHPAKWMTLWAAALLGTAAFNLCAWWLFRRERPSGAAVAKWRNLLILQSALAGLAWALGPTVMISQAPGILIAHFVAMQFCVCAVVIISMAEQRAAMVVYVVAVMAPVAVAALLERDELKHVVAAALLFGMVALILVGINSNRATRRELKTVEQRARADESRHLGEQIAHLDRQRSMGAMASSLAHELNQPLAAILLNAQIVQRGLQGGGLDAQQQSEFNERIIYNTRRAAEVVERIGDFIRPSDMRHVPIQLQDVVQEVASLVADDLRRHDIELVLANGAAPLLVRGDAIALSQVVLNAFRNAIDALAPAARRRIEVSCHRADQHAVLRIRDTGPGLSPQAISKAGEPFFTTKPSGLGLGISISRSIAAQHGGSLSLANAAVESGGGAVVELKLPQLLASTT